jgi:hypothetical protein
MDFIIIALLCFGGAILFVGMILLGLWLTGRGNFYVDVSTEMDGNRILLINNGKIKIIKKKGEVDKWKIIGWKSIKAFQPMGEKNLVPIHKGKMAKVYLFRDSEGEFHIIGWDWNEETRSIVMKPNYRDRLDWGVNDLEEREKLHQKTASWEKNLPLIAIICGMIILTLILVFIPKFVTDSMAKSVEVYNKAIDKTFSDVTGDIDVIKKAADIIRQDKDYKVSENWTEITVGG